MAITFKSIFKVYYIRQTIFKQVEEIHKIENGKTRELSLKGRDIIDLPLLGMITLYAMPWCFVKHYLPARETLLVERRNRIISDYCAHQNATLDTLQHLLEWSPDFDASGAGGLIASTTKYGKFDIVKYLLEKYDNLDMKFAKDTAAKLGHVSIMELLDSYPNTGEYQDNSLEGAAKNGHLDSVVYLHKMGHPTNSKALFLAAQHGHLEVVKFIHFNHKETIFRVNPMDQAAEKGYLEIVEFLHNHHKKGCTPRAMDLAAWFGHFEVVKFLHYNRTEGCSTQAMNRATTLEILQFLHENRTEGCSHAAMDRAAMYGDFEMVKFLHFNRTEGCSTDAMNLAAKKGYLEIFLHLNRTEKWSDHILDNAIQSEDLELVEYIYENFDDDCINGITAEGVEYAAMNGSLDIIEFLHQEYPTADIWTPKAIDCAAKKGHLDIVEFLHDNRSEGSTSNALDKAAENGFLEIVEFLHKNQSGGCTISAMDMAASNSHLDIVKFLHYNRTEGCSTIAMDGAVRKCDLPTIEFLHKNRTEGCTSLALYTYGAQLAR
ncbi:hypothetical protein DFA_04102 [Cavenderia fasciculata]|uniref:Ankyrin repeat-containing protein n=1 Tax=Cavenderia fasciculata TaxID=261658 RepID=F4Q1A7_CACFS|nr:uncharacterized protein DFA_04102 [Cavenderia fasciculata]EGG18608.1 hypothetical protein DFA_04102 [Cavenderia fasciculata]|eukprot:XP_004366512.1 hypothetical protein DFA_04102 [Cavenderia fasciculata]